MRARQLKWTRNGILLTAGLVLLASQVFQSFLGNGADPALVTAGTSIVLSPLLLQRDEKKQ